jgi:SAM-dependent methyltransferase
MQSAKPKSENPLQSRKPVNPWTQCATNPSLLMLMREVQSALSGCETVLDIGCGNCSPLRFLSGPKLVGVDGYAPALEEAKLNQTHDEYVLGDVKAIGQVFQAKQFDACIALDVIEHLEKEDGWRMLEDMERIARKRVVIFTPNGFIPQRSQNGDLQEHLSGWTAEEMRARGYQVYGMYGPKHLRGEYHRIKGSPRFFWVLWSMFKHYTQTRKHPEQSAAIFCVKSLT